MVAAAGGFSDSLGKLIEQVLKIGPPEDMDDVDEDGRTLLHTTASPKLMAALLEAGANPNVADHKGMTPLHTATVPELVAALLTAGADPNATDQVPPPPHFPS